jgi:ribosome recycling factor
MILKDVLKLVDEEFELIFPNDGRKKVFLDNIKHRVEAKLRADLKKKQDDAKKLADQAFKLSDEMGKNVDELFKKNSSLMDDFWKQFDGFFTGKKKGL